MSANDNQPSMGPCVTLQINNDKMSFPIEEVISIPSNFYKLLKDLKQGNRNFFREVVSDYDITNELKNYEPNISKI